MKRFSKEKHKARMLDKARLRDDISSMGMGGERQYRDIAGNVITIKRGFPEVSASKYWPKTARGNKSKP